MFISNWHLLKHLLNSNEPTPISIDISTKPSKTSHERLGMFKNIRNRERNAQLNAQTGIFSFHHHPNPPNHTNNHSNSTLPIPSHTPTDHTRRLASHWGPNHITPGSTAPEKPLLHQQSSPARAPHEHHYKLHHHEQHITTKWAFRLPSTHKLCCALPARVLHTLHCSNSSTIPKARQINANMNYASSNELSYYRAHSILLCIPY